MILWIFSPRCEGGIIMEPFFSETTREVFKRFSDNLKKHDHDGKLIEVFDSMIGDLEFACHLWQASLNGMDVKLHILGYFSQDYPPVIEENLNLKSHGDCIFMLNVVKDPDEEPMTGSFTLCAYGMRETGELTIIFNIVEPVDKVEDGETVLMGFAPGIH